MKLIKKIFFFSLITLSLMTIENDLLAQKSKTKSSKKPKKVGLALSGGGALGYAHIGFLQAMREAKFDVDVISGTSMGSIIGVMYAAGYSPIEILELVDKENMNKITNVIKLNSSFNRGLFNHQKLINVLEKAIPHNDFSQLNKKFYCCVINFNEATYKFVGNGTLLKEYISASASIPIVYEPVQIEGVQYIDGGLMQNLPVEPLVKEKCDLIIGVDVVAIANKEDVKGIMNIISRSIAISVRGNSSFSSRKCDYVITPNLEKYTILDFEKAQELFDIGYDAGKEFFNKTKLKKR